VSCHHSGNTEALHDDQTNCSPCQRRQHSDEETGYAVALREMHDSEARLHQTTLFGDFQQRYPIWKTETLPSQWLHGRLPPYPKIAGSYSSTEDALHSPSKHYAVPQRVEEKE